MNASSLSSSDNQVWRATSLLSVLHGQITHSNELTIGTIGAYHACEWVMAQMCTSQSTNNNKSDLRYPPRSRLCASDRDRTWALMHLRRLLQPDPESSVLSMNVWKLNTQGKSKNVLISILTFRGLQVVQPFITMNFFLLTNKPAPSYTQFFWVFKVIFWWGAGNVIPLKRQQFCTTSFLIFFSKFWTE